MAPLRPRIVLLKGTDERGFVFYTNKESRKGDELADNPRAALLFHWKSLGRQIRIEGRVEIVTDGRGRCLFRLPRRAFPGWAPGPRTSPTHWMRARRWNAASPKPRRATRTRTSPARRTGQATASYRSSFEFWQDMPYRLARPHGIHPRHGRWLDGAASCFPELTVPAGSSKTSPPSSVRSPAADPVETHISARVRRRRHGVQAQEGNRTLLP